MKDDLDYREAWDDEVYAPDPAAESRDFDLFWAAWAALTIVAVLFYLFWPIGGPAKAQEGQIGDYGVGHEQWHHWYQTAEPRADGTPGPLMRPHDPKISCCYGDCRPTLARFRNGQWFVLIDGQYDPVPEERIKRNVTSPNGMAHVCASRRHSTEPIVPFCFVKPEGST